MKMNDEVSNFEAARLEEINEITGFASGDLFESAEQVRRYFNRDEFITATPGLPEGEWPSQDELDDMAEFVIACHAHMA